MTAYVLFLIVEGDDDERFMDHIIKPKLLESYADVRIWQYAKQKQERTANFIESAKKIGDYLFFQDNDNSPCITAKKNEILNTFKGIDEDRIIIVKTEIESWYLAGLDTRGHKQLKIKRYHPTTDEVTKEEYNSLIPRKMHRSEFMMLVIGKHKMYHAKRRNRSYEHFLRKHLNIL